MPEINVKIENKVAIADDSVYVCGNSDYTVIFDFDDEWQDFIVKTARFSYNNSYVDVVFEGLTCSIPIIENTYSFDIGVYAGNLHTTTPARIPCKKSILCKNGSPVDPTPDVYTQLLEQIDNIKSEVAKGEKGDKGDKGDTGPQGPKGDKGDTGASGKDGTNGTDGISATHSWNGTVLTITSASGTSSADLKGEKGDTGPQGTKGDKGDTGAKGDKGEQGIQGIQGIQGLKGADGTNGINGTNGKDGYTPVKGTDYWAATDKAEIVAEVIAQLPDGTGVSY